MDSVYKKHPSSSIPRFLLPWRASAAQSEIRQGETSQSEMELKRERKSHVPGLVEKTPKNA